MLLAVALTLSLAACSGSCGADAPSPDGQAASTSSSNDAVERFATACLGAINWDEALCTCAGRLAEDELSDQALEFVTAMLQEDEATTARLRETMSFEEVTSAGLFMVHAGQTCGIATD